MFLALTNYGHRLISEFIAHCDMGLIETQPELSALARTWESLVLPADGGPLQARLVERGWLVEIGPAPDLTELRLRYRRNPLENVQRLIFEFTTLCNLDCQHCRNGGVRPATASRLDRLVEAVDLMMAIGVRRFDFIGGEVTLYGKGWLDVVRHIATYEGASSAVLTSGWFLGEAEFLAANQRYSDSSAYIDALAEAGLTHVVFSLDGPAEVHDAMRDVPGLHDRILGCFDAVRTAGLTPQVSLLGSTPWSKEAAILRWMTEVSGALYGDMGSPSERVARLFADDMNYVSNLIGVGNGATLPPGEGRIMLDQVDPSFLRCKNFFRPHPSLRIQADGELCLCPLLGAATGYGNIGEKTLIEVLNCIQTAPVAELHGTGQIARYLRYLDREIFGEEFAHVCTLRVVVTLLARGIEEQGVDPNDAQALRALNERVARQAGFLPPVGPVATGITRPR